MATSPTARTMKWFRDRDCTPWVVERWLHAVKRRVDLWNFADVAVIVPYVVGEELGIFHGVHFINVTGGSGGNHAARKAKIEGNPMAMDLLEAVPDATVGVISWRKGGPAGKRKLWRMRWEYRDAHMNQEWGEYRWPQ